MRALIQRVTSASVHIDGNEFSKIDNGLLVLLGIEDEDSESDIDWLSSKISQMRIFDDGNGLMNLSVNDINGKILVVSQFTLHASTKKGNRPSFIRASKPNHAIPMYEEFIINLTEKVQNEVHTGEFGASMQIKLVNDGPVTIWIDSKNRE
ncbi:MAG: D-aminoacyl-tRNA deacylase [Verrucomicrobiota bacterium]|nr:D-aminoacyl-tRNA deacylase [Verrucomicrobiota bacterium]